MIAQAREVIKNPVFWDRPENMGQYRDDRANVFPDGNSNLVIRATRNDDNRYVSGKLVSTFRTGINHTFEARIKFNCLTAGCWPAWWLLNDNPSAAARSTLWSGTATGSGRRAPRSTPDWTASRSRPSRSGWTATGTGGGAPGTTPACTSGWTTSTAPSPTSVPANSLDDWPFNDPGYELAPVLNLAVGGSGGKDPKPGKYPADMLVDWVRVF